MDDMEYHYPAGKNLLGYVADNVESGAFSADFDSQSPSNYTYDGQAGSEIFWADYGKVKLVDFESEDRSVLFGYGPGQKRVKKENSDTNTGLSTYTWYVRDAQGNVLAVLNDRKYYKDTDADDEPD